VTKSMAAVICISNWRHVAAAHIIATLQQRWQKAWQQLYASATGDTSSPIHHSHAAAVMGRCKKQQISEVTAVQSGL
jgi:hypothetical protein